MKERVVKMNEWMKELSTKPEQPKEAITIRIMKEWAESKDNGAYKCVKILNNGRRVLDFVLHKPEYIEVKSKLWDIINDREEVAFINMSDLGYHAHLVVQKYEGKLIIHGQILKNYMSHTPSVTEGLLDVGKLVYTSMFIKNMSPLIVEFVEEDEDL